MWTSTRYHELPEEDLDKLIEDLEISVLYKRFLRMRWLRQSVRAEKLARRLRSQFTLLRVMQIIGGALIPVLVSVNVSGDIFTTLHLATVAISLLVAIVIAAEQFFHFGERWLHYRNVAEWLKIEGWNFLQLSGRYGSYKKYDDAYPIFATRVEEFLFEQEQTSIIDIQRERVMGKKTERLDDHSQKTDSQISSN